MDWKSIVGTVAPGLATALGGPLAGMAVSAISQALLGKPEGTVEDVQAAILGATPATLLELKKADQQFQKDMAMVGVDLERIAASDRDSARKREIETKSYAPAILGAVIVVGFFGVLFSLISGHAVMPKEYELLVGGLIGTLGSALVQVFNYYFGSSAGSAAKQVTLDRLTPTKT